MHLNGFLNIDKPQGMTSTDVVRQIRRLAKQKRVGHGGTLDPMATGVLPIALGHATRLLEYLQEEEDKAYTATIKLGISTDTDDAEGSIINQHDVPRLDLAIIEHVLERFRGEIQQVPPQFSAIRVDGKRMYDRARAGETIELPSRMVTIHRLTLLDWHDDELIVAVACSKGTYIRALARDIGMMLGCGAHLTALRRTQAGAFMLDSAVPLESLNDPEQFTQGLLPPVSALAQWHHIVGDESMIEELRHGRTIQRDSEHERAIVLDAQNNLVAIVHANAETWQPAKVFNE